MKILAYTSPARGHLYPLVPILDELAGRRSRIAVRTLASEVELMSDRQFDAAPIAARSRRSASRRLPRSHAAGEAEARDGHVREALRARGLRQRHAITEATQTASSWTA